MKKHVLKRTLIAAAVLTLAGTAVAGGCNSQGMSERQAANTAAPTQLQTAADDPWAAVQADMARMQARIDQLFNTGLIDVAVAVDAQPANPEISLQEQGDNYVVKADIPGASEDDINIHLDGRLLSISSQSQAGDQLTDDAGQVLQRDSYVSSVQQAFTLPGPVNATGMHTRFDDGVLTITIPKATS